MTWFRWALMLTIAWGVLAFGAVYPWAYGPLAASAAVLGGWASVTTRAWQDPRARRLGLALVVLLAAIAAQIVRLPYGILGRISPGLDRFFREYELGYHPASLHALSLSPDATAVALAIAAALSLLLVGLMRVIRRLPLEWLVGQLMGLGVALALFGIVQKALFDDPHAPVLYGFWRPRDGGNPFGPFVNRNHFAGWMLLVMPMVAMYAWAVLQQAEPPLMKGWSGRLRWLGSVGGNRVLLIVFSAVVMGMALVLTGSRSGVASLGAATLVMLWFILRQLPDRRRRMAAAVYVGALVLAAIGWAGSGMVADRFARVPGDLEGRFAAWRDTAQMIRDFPIAGTGLGAYGQAMLVYQTADRQAMYAQAHNDYLQLAAEGGLLVGIPALLVLGIVVAGIRRRLQSPDDDVVTFWVRRGAVAGLVGIATQSFVEFSLQMPGNAALFVVVAAVALHRPRTGTHARRV